MRVLLKEQVLVLIAESAGEAAEVAAWNAAHEARAFRLRASTGGQALEFHDHGAWEEASREPINIVSNSSDPAARIISNFATTPFDLDGQSYQSVESFWQGLKFPKESDRRRLAACEGPRARSEGEKQGYGATLSYGGQESGVGTWAQWELMARACQARFEQHAEARAALLATGERPLTHIVRRDSKTIPGVIMAAIWMRIRARLRRA